MLRNLLIIAFLFATTVLVAQDVPQAFRYQSVLRDANDVVIANQDVSIRLDLVQNNNSVYQETHSATTNSLGLINLNIGQGTIVAGDFATIDWSQPTGLGIAVDPTGGTDYVDFGALQLLSVPYALYAGNAGGEDADADPANEIQMLSQDGATVTLSLGGGTVSINDADADPANEIQTLTQDGTNVTLSGNGGTISVEDGDSDASNEIEMPQDAQAGDVAFYNGSDWVRVPAGQGGQMLTLDNNSVPYWSGPTTDGLIQATPANGQRIYVHPTVNVMEAGFNPGMTWNNLMGLDDIANPSVSASLSDFDGEGNTEFIVNNYGDGNYAAKVCYDLEAFGFDDWYLPAAGEMNKIYSDYSLDAGNGTFAGPLQYWTSSVYTNPTTGISTIRFGFSPSGNIRPEDNGGKVQVLCIRK